MTVRLLPLTNITRKVTPDEQLLACKHLGFRICKIFQPELAQMSGQLFMARIQIPITTIQKTSLKTEF